MFLKNPFILRTQTESQPWKNDFFPFYLGVTDYRLSKMVTQKRIRARLMLLLKPSTSQCPFKGEKEGADIFTMSELWMQYDSATNSV